MQPSLDDLERLRQAHNRQHPGATIARIGDESAAVQHLWLGRGFWDGSPFPIAEDDRAAIEDAPPVGAFT